MREDIYRLMKAKMRGGVQSYLKAKAELEATENPSEKQCDNERLLRGIVRGQAMMLLVYTRPSHHRDKHALEVLEAEFGFPHPHITVPPVSPTVKKFLDDYYDE